MQKKINKKIIILTAGGSGGHVFPAQAIAEKLQDQYDTLFITDKRGMRFAKGALLKANTTILPVTKTTGTLYEKMHALSMIILSFIILFFKFFKQKPNIVIGFGGYPSVPAILAAYIHQIPIVLHEQNAVMGKANHFLAKIASTIALSFKGTKNIPQDQMDKVIYTGNPIRAQIMALAEKAYKKVDYNQLRILVIGGSQGAAIFSQVLPAAIQLLEPELQKKLHIYQQAREDAVEETKESYRKTNTIFEVRSFFDDIENLLYKCDIVIARSGAATVMEIIAAKKPSILVPLPSSQNNHQFYNAKFLSDQKCALLIEEQTFTPQTLQMILANILNDKQIIASLQSELKKIKAVDAATEFQRIIFNAI